MWRLGVSGGEGNRSREGRRGGAGGGEGVQGRVELERGETKKDEAAWSQRACAQGD